MNARLLSVNVGLPQEIMWRGQTVRTSVWKKPVLGKRLVRRLNVDGDVQGDLVGHGGAHRAVFVYQIESYRYWQDYLHRTNFTFGQFGENFTIEGLPDAEVCIGDRYRIGGALFEVTQPRVTCYRVGIRLDEPRMAALLVSHGRPGFYFRVLEEGEVQGGDEIVKVGTGPEGMSVAEVNGLLYLKHPKEKLERALRIPALSTGWQDSFRALLETEMSGRAVTGNPGLTPGGLPPPAWPGFRPLRVSQKGWESDSVFSFELVSTDDKPLAIALPGQFVILRLRAQEEHPLLRSFSLCGPQSCERYRLGIKTEPLGAASLYLADHVNVGDVLDASAPRGSFVLRPGDRPIVLISAGVGVTPVLAMLYALASEPSDLQVWWFYGARNENEHPFAEEARRLIRKIPRGLSYVQYSRPGREDQPGSQFNAPGHLGVSSLKSSGVSPNSDFYLCGPPAFLRDFISELAAWNVAPERVHTEIFGPGKTSNPGIAQAPARSPHPPAGVSGKGPRVSFSRSSLDVNWDPAYKSLLELAEACDVPVQWSCRAGVCHTCERALVSGEVQYDPEPLEPPTDGNLLTCCSRPQGDVVIDL